jgi:hypothetical protein
VRLAPLLWYLGLTMLLLCIVTCREKDLQAQLGVQNRRLKFARSKQIQSNTKSKYDPRPLAIDWNQLPEGTQDVIEHQIQDFVHYKNVLTIWYAFILFVRKTRLGTKGKN